MATIRVEGVTKRFGRVLAIDNLSFEVADGEFFCLLGPSGAGKTTTLRLIAGLERPSEGEIYLDDRCVTGIHPSRRSVAMLFENLALYPDRTAFDNIAFPLRIQKLPETEIKHRVLEVARLLSIEHVLDRKPATLSGGERQRVALGRVMVRKPRLYLLDEPLTNLDALIRLNMRAELKRLQRDLGQTIIYASPDQAEAMSMADRILVLHQGHIQQIGTPLEIYFSPANAFVAGFIGSPPMNLIPATLHYHDGQVLARFGSKTLPVPASRMPEKRPSGDQVLIGIRPEHIQIVRAVQRGTTLDAQVVAVEPLGSKTVVDVRIEEQLLRIVAEPEADYASGDLVRVSIDPRQLYLFDAETGLACGNREAAPALPSTSPCSLT